MFSEGYTKIVNQSGTEVKLTQVEEKGHCEICSHVTCGSGRCSCHQGSFVHVMEWRC